MKTQIKSGNLKSQKSHEKSEKKFQEVSRGTFGLQNCFTLKD